VCQLSHGGERKARRPSDHRVLYTFLEAPSGRHEIDQLSTQMPTSMKQAVSSSPRAQLAEMSGQGTRQPTPRSRGCFTGSRWLAKGAYPKLTAAPVSRSGAALQLSDAPSVIERMDKGYRSNVAGRLTIGVR
jgi:hypothetical protein